MMDVSRLLADPEFAQSFVVLRRIETVNNQGRAEYAEETIQAVGAIQPATPKELERLPEGDRHKETIAVFTVAPLHAGDEKTGTAPDLIVRQGAYYEVVSLNDWSGQGFCHALAQRTTAWPA